jgi:hypothetical protein
VQQAPALTVANPVCCRSGQGQRMHFHRLKRREFITLLGGAVAWPLAARTQQPEQMRRIGVLMAYAESDPEAQVWVAAFREELLKLGWLPSVTRRSPSATRRCSRGRRAASETG